MKGWLDSIPNLSPRFPKPINLPPCLDTRQSDRTILSMRNKQWANRRRQFKSKLKIKELDKVHSLLRSQGVDSMAAEELTTEISNRELVEYRSFLENIELGSKLLNTSQDFTSHRLESKDLSLSVLGFKRKILLSLMLSDNKADREKGIKFIMNFNRIYEADSPVKNKPKKDFRFIDIKDRLRLMNSRRHYYIVNLINQGNILNPNFRSKKQKNVSLQDPREITFLRRI